MQKGLRARRASELPVNCRARRQSGECRQSAKSTTETLTLCLISDIKKTGSAPRNEIILLNSNKLLRLKNVFFYNAHVAFCGTFITRNYTICAAQGV